MLKSTYDPKTGFVLVEVPDKKPKPKKKTGKDKPDDAEKVQGSDQG